MRGRNINLPARCCEMKWSSRRTGSSGWSSTGSFANRLNYPQIGLASTRRIPTANEDEEHSHHKSGEKGGQTAGWGGEPIDMTDRGRRHIYGCQTKPDTAACTFNRRRRCERFAATGGDETKQYIYKWRPAGVLKSNRPFSRRQ